MVVQVEKATPKALSPVNGNRKTIPLTALAANAEPMAALVQKLTSAFRME